MTAWRVSAHDLEKLVCDKLAVVLLDQQALCRLIEPASSTAQLVAAVFERGDLAAVCRAVTKPATGAPALC